MWVAWIGLAVASGPELTSPFDLEPPEPPAPDPVVGGTVVEAGGWPDAVGVVFDSWYVGCTGTLIRDDVVLTAAHCTGGISHVVVGATDWTRGGDWIPVSRVHEHPSWSSTFDVALLELSRPASVQPRALAMDCVTHYHLQDGAEVAVVGYGMTDAAGTRSTTQLHEGYTYVADADCGATYIDGFYAGCNGGARPAGEIAAGGNGVDACFGDSGGPLYLLTPSGDYLIGVTSRAYAGVPWSQPCLYGGIYTRPDAVVDWIEDRVGPVTYPQCNRAPEVEADVLVVETGVRSALALEITDPDGAMPALTTRLVTPPAHGKARALEDGSVEYESDPGYVGADSFVVEVDDGGNPEWPRTGQPLATSVVVDVEVVPVGSKPAGGTSSLAAADGVARPDGAPSYRALGCGCASGAPPRGLPASLVLLLLIRRRW